MSICKTWLLKEVKHALELRDSLYEINGVIHHCNIVTISVKIPEKKMCVCKDLLQGYWDGDMDQPVLSGLGLCQPQALMPALCCQYYRSRLWSVHDQHDPWPYRLLNCDEWKIYQVVETLTFSSTVFMCSPVCDTPEASLPFTKWASCGDPGMTMWMV